MDFVCHYHIIGNFNALVQIYGVSLSSLMTCNVYPLLQARGHKTCSEAAAQFLVSESPVGL